MLRACIPFRSVFHGRKAPVAMLFKSNWILGLSLRSKISTSHFLPTPSLEHNIGHPNITLRINFAPIHPFHNKHILAQIHWDSALPDRTPLFLCASLHHSCCRATCNPPISPSAHTSKITIEDAFQGSHFHPVCLSMCHGNRKAM